MSRGKMGHVTGMERNRLRPGGGRRAPRAAIQQPDRRLPSPRGGGRAWINGREVGGADRRYLHLDFSYD